VTGESHVRGLQTICLATVNSYLVAAEGGFVLSDTSKPDKRRDLETRLLDAGCTPPSSPCLSTLAARAAS
jgi:hypothetical protein